MPRPEHSESHTSFISFTLSGYPKGMYTTQEKYGGLGQANGGKPWCTISHTAKCQRQLQKSQGSFGGLKSVLGGRFRQRAWERFGQCVSINTKVIMPKEKNSNFGNLLPRAYSVWFITNGCGSWTFAWDRPKFQQLSGSPLLLSLHVREGSDLGLE